MKTIGYIILICFLSCPVSLSQSKKELQAQVNQLISDKQELQSEILTLKQQMLDLKQELFNTRNENEKLKSEIAVSSNSDKSKESMGKPTESKANSNLVGDGRCQATTAKGTQCSRKADPGSNYCWQHKSTYDPNSEQPKTIKSSPNTKSSGSSTTSGGRTIYTGPRGGKYYINSHGNKTYVK